jgi:hypothetical protein
MDDEMAMKRRGGTKSKIVVERMLNVFDLHFPTPAVKQCLEFTLAKLREIFKYLAGACNSNIHARGLHYLTFVCKTRQGNQRNEASRLRKCIKRAKRYQFALNAKKSLCKLNSLQCHQKTTTSL